MERAGDALTATIADAVARDRRARRGAARRRPRLLRLPRLRPRRLGGALRRDAAARRRGRRAGRRLPRPDRRPGLRLAARPAAAAHAARPPRSRSRPSPTALLGAAEALARWWLRTEAISAERGRRAADRDDRAGPAPARGPAPTPPPRPTERRPAVDRQPRRVAVIGGNRIPFARSDSAYAHASNQDMLTAALDGLIDRFGLDGETPRRGRRRRRAQALPRPRPDPRERARHPARAGDARLRRPAGLRHRAGDDDPGRQQDRPRADRRRASPAASTPPPTRRSRSTRTCARRCSRPTAQRSTAGKLRALTGVRPGHVVPGDPAQRGAAHRPLDGRALRDHGRANGRSAAPSRTSSTVASHREPRRRLRARLPRRPDHPLPRPRARPEPAPGLRAARSWRS